MFRFNYIQYEVCQFVPAVDPPLNLVEEMMNFVQGILIGNPLVTGSEKHLEAMIEQRFLLNGSALRIGINYHGANVQHIQLNEDGNIVGWNPEGDVFARSAGKKMILKSNSEDNPGTIIDREVGEHSNSDTKIQNGRFLATDEYVRIEHKVRGWLGKTRNLDGEQLMKDIALLLHNQADLLHWSLSEAAYRKFRGEGPANNARRRAGTTQFFSLLPNDQLLENNNRRLDYYVNINGDYTWRNGVAGTPIEEGDTTTFNFPVSVSVAKVDSGNRPPMPHCIHYVIMIRRQNNTLHEEALLRRNDHSFDPYFDPWEHTEGTILHN